MYGRNVTRSGSNQPRLAVFRNGVVHPEPGQLPRLNAVPDGRFARSIGKYHDAYRAAIRPHSKDAPHDGGPLSEVVAGDHPPDLRTVGMADLSIATEHSSIRSGHRGDVMTVCTDSAGMDAMTSRQSPECRVSQGSE
jgi:hypothetical protein